MGVALGWQRMVHGNSSGSFGVDGMAWNDGISRSGNRVTYSINFCMKLYGTKSAYWDYDWYVDMWIGNNVSNNRKIKGSTSWHGKIMGKEYYQSAFNGNFTGVVDVDGKASHITLGARFHDSKGNYGWDRYWIIPIPTANSMSNISVNVSDITTDEAKIKASITKKGDYSTITGFTLYYGVQNVEENVLPYNRDVMDYIWILKNLIPDTTYKYRVIVNNSAGYRKETTGEFRTLEEDIGYRVISSEEAKKLIGYIIFPDGRVQKIKEIRSIKK